MLLTMAQKDCLIWTPHVLLMSSSVLPLADFLTGACPMLPPVHTGALVALCFAPLQVMRWFSFQFSPMEPLERAL